MFARFEIAPMYVCLCKGVTCRQIKEAAGNGVFSMKGLAQQLGVATQCGKCGPLAKEVLQSAIIQLPTPSRAA